MDRPANSQMIQGYMDGYDLTAPEPSANRSASYRHGWTAKAPSKPKRDRRLVKVKP